MSVIESPRRHLANRNGPVPTGRKALPAADCGETITADPNASDWSSPPERRFSAILMVLESTISTERMAPNRDRCGLMEPAAMRRSSEYFAAAALKELPS